MKDSFRRRITILETDRLLLRSIETADAAAFYTLFADPEVMRFGDGPQTETWVNEWIVWVRQGYAQQGYGPLAVVEKSSVSVIGYCGLFFFEDINGAAEIELGYRLLPEAWGKGYATEAGTAVRDYAFEILGLPRLISLIDPANNASIAVAKKLGMVREGEVMLEGYTHPDFVFSLSADQVDY
jgi:hypothetical protein